jgi:hypothetical protein
MSRSVKKVGGGRCGDGSHHRRFAKKDANHKVRRSHLYANGCFYKKMYYQYKICDYNFRLRNVKELEEYLNRYDDAKEAVRQRYRIYAK